MYRGTALSSSRAAVILAGEAGGCKHPAVVSLRRLCYAMPHRKHPMGLAGSFT